MKALSVRGDYLMEMISGRKKVEYRSWKTNYRGPILMCSDVFDDSCRCSTWLRAMRDEPGSHYLERY